MKGYKVVKEGPRGGLTSCIVWGKAKVRYRKGRFNTAPKWLAEKGNHLTIFTNLRKAKEFKSPYQQIWSVLALDVFEPSMKQKFQIIDLSEGEILTSSIGWPEGTKMAKRVYLIDRITSNFYGRK